MMTRKIIYIIINVFIAICIITVLNFFSIRANKVKNGFTRNIKNLSFKLEHSIKINFEYPYIAGVTSYEIFLASQKNRAFFKTNYSFTDTSYNIFPLLENTELKNQTPIILIDSPYAYLGSDDLPNLLCKNLNTPNKVINNTNKFHFSSFIGITPYSYILRTFDPICKQNVLAKVSDNDWHKKYQYLLEKQIDGIFCTDGMLKYNHFNKSLTYLFYYRNEFITLDTNLNLIAKGKTIDTTSQVKFKLAKLGNATTFSSPPQKVNKECCIANNKLYVNSSLLADNENKSNFNSNTIIDVYNLTNNNYEYSFYIPAFKGLTASKFFIFNNRLIVLYGEFLITYVIQG